MRDQVKAAFDIKQIQDYKRIIFPSNYVQGKNLIKNMIEVLSLEGKSLLIVATPSMYYKVIPQCIDIWKESATVNVEKFNGECDYKEISRLVNLANSFDKLPDYVIGMGGGKALDTAKSVAVRINKNCGVIPTIAASDAPCIGVSVIYDENRRFKELEFLPNPAFVLVDSTIIAKAPVRYLSAGIGDALSTWYEAQACEQSKSQNYTNSLRTDAGYFLAKLCYDNLFRYGRQAYLDNQKGIVTDALEHIIETNILLSGVGVENTGLASAHFIQFGLSQLGETKGFLHGEEVTIGVLAELFLNKKSYEEIDEVYSLCEFVNLPTRLRDIGIDETRDNIDELLIRVSNIACTAGIPNCHEPFNVSAEDIVFALKQADNYGRNRKRYN